MRPRPKKDPAGVRNGSSPDRRDDRRQGRPSRPPTQALVSAGGGAPLSTMRIAKAMARAGLCSRRDAERWIADGRVEVNGTKITSPALDVGPGDRILIDGQALPTPEPTRLWRYSKPRGVVTTHRDPEGRPTVFDSLADDMPRVLSIGRLDYNTEGLLLLTTDGELARYLELPSTGWLRRYRVRAHGRITEAALDQLKDGIEVAGVHYGPIEARLDSVQGTNVWLTLGIREGKNREVRTVLQSLGLEVNRLIRISFGPFELLDLAPGAHEIVKRKVLRDQLGAKLASRFHLAADDGEDADQRPHRGSGPRHPEPSARRRPAPDDTRRARRPERIIPRPASGETHERRGGPAGGDQARRRTPQPVEAVEVDETQLDDIKPWTEKPRDGAPRPGTDPRSRTLRRVRGRTSNAPGDASVPRKPRRP